MSEPEATTMRAERRWPMALAVLAAIGLQVGTPHPGRLPLWWIFPTLEFAMLVMLLVVDPGRIDDRSASARPHDRADHDHDGGHDRWPEPVLTTSFMAGSTRTTCSGAARRSG